MKSYCTRLNLCIEQCYFQTKKKDLGTHQGSDDLKEVTLSIKTFSRTTMSAKNLGVLPIIYATDELQNPLPLKTMLCEGDMNNPVCRSDAFLHN